MGNVHENRDLFQVYLCQGFSNKFNLNRNYFFPRLLTHDSQNICTKMYRFIFKKALEKKEIDVCLLHINFAILKYI